MQAEFVVNVRAFRESVRSFTSAHLRSRTIRARHASQHTHAAPPTAEALPAPDQPAIDDSATRLLTRRQLEIADLIARGYSNQRIAEALVLTPGTVANHVQHILDRLEVHSRTQVAVWYASGARGAPSGS